MLPPALGGLRFRVPPVPGHPAPGIMSKITLPSGYPHGIKIILFLIRFRQLAILPNFFGINVDVVWPAKSTALRLNLSEEDGVAQLAPIVFLEIRRAFKDADAPFSNDTLTSRSSIGSAFTLKIAVGFPY